MGKQPVKKNTPEKRVKINAKPSNRNIWLALAAVLALTLVSYFPSVNNGFIRWWDDDNYVSENAMLPNDKAADYFTKDKFVMGNYHPLTMLSFSMDYAASKLNPKRYHIDNLILHLFNTAFVFLLVFLLLGRWEGAAIASALFGVHPMHVESVAWVAERKDVLYTFFYLASLIAYIYYIRNKKPGLYAGALTLFLLSLLSKGQAVTLPLSMLLVDYFCNRKFTIKTITEKIPFFALSLAFGIIAIIAQHSSKTIDTTRVFAFNNFLYAFYGLANYIFKFVAPIQLSCFYPYPPTGGALPVIFYVMPFVVIGPIALVYFKFRTNKSIVFGALFFLLNIIPLLQLLPVGSSIISDRYTYIPYIGLCFIAAYVVMYFMGFTEEASAKRTNGRPPLQYKNVALTIVVLAIAGFAYAGNERCRVWKDSETLWGNVLENYPNVGKAYSFLGYIYCSESKEFTAQNNPEQAKLLMEKAMRYYKNCSELQPGDYDAFDNLGLGYTSLGKYDSAIYYLTGAIRIQPRNSKGWANRSDAYRNVGQNDSALADINHAIALSPDTALYYDNRAVVYFYKGMFANAIKDYKATISKETSPGLLYNDLGLCYTQLGMYDSAIFYFNKMLGIDPNHQPTYINRGFAHSAKAEYNEAIKDYTTGINMNQSDAQAYCMRSEAFLAIQDKKSAMADALRAKQLGFPVKDEYMAKLGK